MIEASVERRFNELVRARGGYTFKLAPTEAGIPDRLVLLPGGRIFLVELKTTTGRLSRIQGVWHAKAARVGTKVAVLHGRAEVEAWVEAHS